MSAAIPNGLPPALSRSEQSQEINSTIGVLGLNSAKPITHFGLWTGVWSNYLSLKAALTSGLDVVWSGRPAEAGYVGRTGSLFSDVGEYESQIMTGNCVYVELDTARIVDLAPAFRLLFASSA
eukprot:2391908-Amphidinium_carterae.2